MGDKGLVELYEKLRDRALKCGTHIEQISERGIKLVCANGVIALWESYQDLVGDFPKLAAPAMSSSAREPRGQISISPSFSKEITTLLADMTLGVLEGEV